MHDTTSEGLELVSSYPGNPVLPPFIAPGISSGYWHFILFYFPFSSRTAALLRNTAASPAAWSGEALFDAFGAKKASYGAAGSAPKAECHRGKLWIRPGREAVMEEKMLLLEFCLLGPSLVRVPLLTYVTRLMAEEMTARLRCLYDGSD